MGSLWLDIRYALRMMARTPGLTAVLIVTLALGIGASTTIFSVVSSVVLRPLPYEQSDRLVRVYTEITGKGDLPRLGVSVPAFRELQRGCQACASVAAWTQGSASLAGGDRPVRVQATYASHELLPLLGVRPLLGRWFDDNEDRPGPPTVVVLGYDVWQRVFGGDPALVGKQIHLDALPVTVIGVMPRGFRFPEREDIWVPARLDFTKAAEQGASFPLGLVVRLSPGASLAALRDELVPQVKLWTEWLNRMTSQAGFPPLAVRAQAVPYQADLIGSLATTLWLLQGAVLFVLLISVVNVANLLLARSESRAREVAVRHALGASRRRLLRQFITVTSFAGIALLLAAVGIYGVMAHTVAQRTHEIGLRVALGARPAQVRGMVLRQAATLVAAGVAIGLAVPGEVVRIDPAAQNGNVTVDVRLTTPLPKAARVDQNVEGVIELARTGDVLHLARPAIGEAHQAATLFVLTAGGEAHRVAVTFGRAAQKDIEISAGLAAGDQVVLSDMSRWDGIDRLRIE